MIFRWMPSDDSSREAAARSAKLAAFPGRPSGIQPVRRHEVTASCAAAAAASLHV